MKTMNQFVQKNNQFLNKNNRYSNRGSVFDVPSQTEISLIRKETFSSSEDFHNLLNFENLQENHGKTKTELQDVISSMSHEICKLNPNVEMFSVRNVTWKKEENIKPSTEKRSFVFVNEKMYFSGYPYSLELTKKDISKFQQDFDLFSNFRFFEANEGTMIRVFYVDEKWYTSTNKKLDAFTSKWAAKKNTFGIQLYDAICLLFDEEKIIESDFKKKIEITKENLNNIWEKSLEKDKKYFFLLKPCEEERIVCLTSKDRLKNIGILDKNNILSLDEDVSLTFPTKQKTILISRPKERFFESEENFLEELDKLNEYECPGFMAICIKDFKTSEDISKNIERSFHVRIFSDKYKYLFSLRDNVPSLRFRYFQLSFLKTKESLHDKDSENYQKAFFALENFCNLYKDAFNKTEVDSFIWKIVTDLFLKYQSFYVRHEKFEISPTIKSTMSTIHNEYIESQYKKKTDPKRISDIVSCLKPTFLNKLIKEYQDQEKTIEI
jgi:hypothetical protein